MQRTSPGITASSLRGALLALLALAGPAAARQGAHGTAVAGPAPQKAYVGLVDLPPGFHYRVVADESTLYTDGHARPGDADGMGAFPGPGGTTLLCVNHELSDGEPPEVPHVAGDYDPNASGGTSIMVVGRDRRLKKALVSSSGTARNCSGGATSWGTWITVEESLDANGTYTHGWAFEVDPYAPLNDGTPRQVRLDALGRFFKEGLAIDPHTGVVYQTEDLTDGLLYRFVPTSGTRPKGYGAYAHAPGRLQALHVTTLGNANRADPGDTFTPQWIDVPDPDGDPVPTRSQTYLDDLGIERRPTRFYRGEGCVWNESDSAIWFDATGGGTSGHLGQIWRYAPRSNQLTLVIESTSAAFLDMPDNLLALPWGDMVVCEDGSGRDHLRILSRDGQLVDFASNGVSEFAGASWGEESETLFVNLQSPSITVAIWGDWSLLRR